MTIPFTERNSKIRQAQLEDIPYLSGIVINGGTAGNLQLQWAQQTATAVNTKVLTNSYLTAWR